MSSTHVAESAPQAKTFADEAKDVFYLSFRHSQGDDKDLHPQLLDVAANYQRTQWGEVDPNAIDTFLAGSPAVPELHMPVSHGPEPNEVIQRQFRTFWDVYKDKLAAAEGYNPSNDRTHNQLLTLGAAIVAIDTVHVTKGRNSVRPPRDRHSSFFRQYVRLGNNTGSPVFDAIFSNILPAINTCREPSLYPGRPLQKLSDTWEGKHPGKRFFPPYKEDLDYLRQHAEEFPSLGEAYRELVAQI